MKIDIKILFQNTVSTLKVSGYTDLYNKFVKVLPRLLELRFIFVSKSIDVFQDP